MKKFAIPLIVAAMVFGVCVCSPAEEITNEAVANEKAVTVVVDGVVLDTEDCPPIIKNDRTLVPMRAIFEALGAEVTWQEEPEAVFAVKKTRIIYIPIGENFYVFGSIYDGQNYATALDVPAEVINDRTMVPVRVVAESMGASVLWDGQNNSVIIFSEEAVIPKFEKGAKVKAEINVEKYGKIELELLPDIAPETVGNFVGLAESGFYDGVLFHRVEKDFVIQGGAYALENGQTAYRGSTTIEGEFSANGFENTLLHKRGVISMARTQATYNSASAQFFICLSDSDFLDGQYAAFGKVTKGMDVVDEISKLDPEKENIVIKSIKIIR